MQDRSKLAEPVLEQLADAVICADRSGVIVRWNRASIALFWLLVGRGARPESRSDYSWATMTKRHHGRPWHCRTIRTFNLDYVSPPPATQWPGCRSKHIAARLRQLNPALRVSTLKNVLGPYRRAKDLSRFEEGLRRAGLPE